MGPKCCVWLGLVEFKILRRHPVEWTQKLEIEVEMCLSLIYKREVCKLGEVGEISGRIEGRAGPKERTLRIPAFTSQDE